MVQPNEGSQNSEQPSDSEKNFYDRAPAELQHEIHEALRAQWQRAEWTALVKDSLADVPEDLQQNVIDLMDVRGLLPREKTGKRKVSGLPEERQNVLKDPEGLTKQCLRLGAATNLAAKLLNFSLDEIRDATVAASIINTGKAVQIAGLEDDLKRLQNYSDNERAIEMLAGYNAREEAEYDETRHFTSHNVYSILRENIRHDPSQLRTPLGQLVYYILCSQVPDTGQLVPVADRVNASIYKHPVYGEIYKGYKIWYKQDLVQVHEETIAGCELLFKRELRKNGYEFSNLREFLNSQMQGLTLFAPPESE